jgi:hypothetical protein
MKRLAGAVPAAGGMAGWLIPFSFTPFQLPTGQAAWIPTDIELRIPDKTCLDPELLHYLIFIPWQDKYLELIDEAYRDFFKVVLPYLHKRSTDVHVATCFRFIKELVLAEQESVDERVVHIAFMLHDSGWSQMSEAEIAQSLGIQGLKLSGGAINPKAKHAILGQQIAQKILGEYPFDPPLTSEQKAGIYQAILFHDKPQELAAAGGIPTNMKVVCNADHLWSFTHPNFWQDTLRKGVKPEAYLENLRKDLDNYFVSEPGKQKARKLLEARSVEVDAWKRWVQRKS